MGNGTKHKSLIPPSVHSLAKSLLVFVLGFLLYPLDAEGQTCQLDDQVSLPRQTSTIYSLLNQISNQTGCFFIYDSELINNNLRVSIKRTREDVRTLLNEILNDPSLSYRTIENHILIFRAEPVAEEMAPLQANVVKPSTFVVRGRVLDQVSGNPLPFASVGLPERGLGISTNNEGYFQLRLPMEIMEQDLHVSYLGYKSQSLPLRLLLDNQVDILMETDYISMQEVIIRYYDPRELIKEALARRPENYSDHPVYLVSFYREGVQRNDKFLSYSEAIFRIFKSSYTTPTAQDQVMLHKARNITNVDRSDTLVLKLKAGVQSVLELDIMKQLPDFLDEEFMDDYEFTSADLMNRNGRSVFAIEFKPHPFVNEPLFTGMIYLDKEDLAVIEADFEIDRKYINQLQHRFLTKRNPNYVSRIESATYSINYLYYNGRYYLNHLRGELKLRFRRKGSLFSNRYTAFIEMAVGKIEEENVSRFNRREVLEPKVVFVDQGYQYDESFWGEYNIITPETKVSEALSQIKSRIESFVREE
ncbi:MAG: carboxypeptidase-like regulatory domain-containing protein [Bacteroides sp.]|jgi:hypothetical protein|nr:carboxypeptidase-like regulatory domain-containing protein [Bacteroides sp.]